MKKDKKPTINVPPKNFVKSDCKNNAAAYIKLWKERYEVQIRHSQGDACLCLRDILQFLKAFFSFFFLLLSSYHCHINPYKRCWNNYYSLLTTNTRLLSLHSWFWSASVFVRYTLHCTGKKDLLVFWYLWMSKRKIAKYEMTHLLSHLFFSKLL